MNVLNYVYQRVNILSIDVAAGAVVSAMFFSALLKAPANPVSLVALAMTVWIIYTIDHLRDAKSIRRTASAERHRFHQIYFRPIAAGLCVAAVLDLVAVVFLSDRLIYAGAALGAIVIVYLLLQRYLKFMKEFFVACLYCCGILLPSLTVPHVELDPFHYLIIGKFFITALMNLLLFSLIDYHEDTHDQQYSFVTWFGPKWTRTGIIFLGLVNIVSGIWLWQSDWRVAMVFVSMNLLLLTVLFLRRSLRHNNLYRMLGDAVFFIPAIYLL